MEFKDLLGSCEALQWLLKAWVLVSPTSLSGTIFSPLCIPYITVEDELTTYVWIYFCAFYSGPSGQYVSLYAGTMLFRLLQPHNIFWNKDMLCLHLSSSFSGLIWPFVVLLVPHEWQDFFFSISVKIVLWILIEIAMNL